MGKMCADHTDFISRTSNLIHALFLIPPYVNSMACWFAFVNLAQAKVTWEGGISAQEPPPSDWPMGKPVGHFLDWGLMQEDGVCCCHPGHVGLGCVRNKPISSAPLWFPPEFLPCLPSIMHCNFPALVAFGHSVLSQQRKTTGKTQLSWVMSVTPETSLKCVQTNNLEETHFGVLQERSLPGPIYLINFNIGAPLGSFMVVYN